MLNTAVFIMDSTHVYADVEYQIPNNGVLGFEEQGYTNFPGGLFYNLVEFMLAYQTSTGKPQIATLSTENIILLHCAHGLTGSAIVHYIMSGPTVLLSPCCKTHVCMVNC